MRPKTIRKKIKKLFLFIFLFRAMRFYLYFFIPMPIYPTIKFLYRLVLLLLMVKI